MPIYSIGKQRESLTFSSETYKVLIRKYMDSMGYMQLTDSFVEGHLSDMIFINPSISIERRTYVEAKATEISLSDERFSVEILNYLAEWLKQQKNERFELFIFTKKISNKKEFDKIFGSKYSVSSLKSWITKYKKKTSDIVKKIIDSSKFNDVVAFISSITIYEADISQLNAAIEEKHKHSNLSLEKYAKNLLRESERRSKPIKQKNNLISNLVPLNIPNKIYRAKIKFDEEKEIYEYYNNKGIEIPPIVFDPENQIIYTFCEIDKDSPLKEIIVSNSKEIAISNFEIQFVINLINRHLRRIFWKKGLRRVPKTNVFFFECPNENGVFKTKTCPNKQNKEKEVTIPMYKENHELNFIFHHAIEISAKRLWGKFYLLITPKREYSLDGFTPVERSLKAVIDRGFRNPLFNRSSNKLSELRFWYFYLFESQKFDKSPEKWFKNFKYGQLEIIPFEWTPQTLPLNQLTLGEYNETHIN